MGSRKAVYQTAQMMGRKMMCGRNLLNGTVSDEQNDDGVSEC
jgi:hypothetical protein